MSGTPASLPVSGTVPVDGARLRYVVEGQGYPCLVVGSTTYYRRTFSQPLLERLRSAFMDHRGFLPGASTGAQERYTFAMLADDIEQVRRALGWERLAVYGHSVHGLIALEYARQHPEHVSHVVMEATPPCWGAKFSQAAESYWASAASSERKALLERNRQGIEERLKGMSEQDAFVANYVANGPKYWPDPTYDGSWLWEGVDLNMELTGQFFGSIPSDYDVAGRHPPVAAPIFVAMGQHDYVVPFTTWDERRRTIGDLTFRLFEQSGHIPHLEEPERYAADLASWLRQH